jgi:Ni2+-binding GTPase involved in maturation of urease and hydrogenase
MYSIKRVAKKLVILQGNSSIGKITILLQVIDHLKEGRNFVTVTHQLMTRHDQRVLLKNDRGFSVEICTAGDSMDTIEEQGKTIGTRCNFHIFHKILHLGLSDCDFGIPGTG